MRTTRKNLVVTLLLLVLFNAIGFAQEETPAGPEYVVITTNHWNMDYEDFDKAKWIATEKEFLDKITKKNDYIMGSSMYMHRFTPDNTEIVSVQTFANWEAIDKAGERTAELVRETWPDQEARRAYFQSRNAYYSNDHSDEIYATMSNAKVLAPTDKEMVWLVRRSHFAFPKDGSGEEFRKLNKEYVENVFHKNEHIKGYYPMAHSWGSDRTEFLEAFAVESLAALDKMFERNGELYKAHWSDEAKRKEMDKSGQKYFTGVHGDYIYTSVPELSK